MKPSNPYKPALAALALTLAALLLATCPNPAISSGEAAGEAGPGSADIPAGTGLAVIQLEGLDGGNAARTALPGIDGYLFILRFTDTDDDGDGNVKDPVHLPLRGAMSITVPLEIGTWNLVVDAYTDSGQDLTFRATGSTTVPVAAGTTAAFTVELDLGIDFSGTGTLTYDISVPASTRGWLGLYPLDVPEFSGGIFDDPDAPTPADPADDRLERNISNPEGTASGTVSGIPGGAYRAVIDLYNEGTNKFAVYSTIVHIYNGQSTPLNRTFTLEGNFADCPPKVTGNTLEAKLTAALEATAPDDCTIVLDGTESDVWENNNGTFVPKTLSVTGNRNRTITIRGNGRRVSLSGSGSLFTLSANPNASLTLALHDVTLRGHTGNTSSLVRVDTGATLELRAGSLITGNTAVNGGGVSVGGTLTMIGGEISGNKATGTGRGGGVYVGNGTFTLNGGAVSRNSASDGGGVSVLSNGTFALRGGAVSANTASSDGGGVRVYGNGGFTLSGGAVSANTASAGGGLYVTGTSGTFTLSGGTVSRNTASSRGGGMSVNDRTVTMSGGEISGNITITSGEGGGVYVGSNGTVTMSGGEISGNIASADGGGVYVGSSGTFIKQGGGTIYGSDNSTLKNTAKSDSRGHAVYVYSGGKKRTTTAGPSVDLDSAADGIAGGWD